MGYRPRVITQTKTPTSHSIKVDLSIPAYMWIVGWLLADLFRVKLAYGWSWWWFWIAMLPVFFFVAFVFFVVFTMVSLWLYGKPVERTVNGATRIYQRGHRTVLKKNVRRNGDR